MLYVAWLVSSRLHFFGWTPSSDAKHKVNSLSQDFMSIIGPIIYTGYYMLRICNIATQDKSPFCIFYIMNKI